MPMDTAARLHQLKLDRPLPESLHTVRLDTWDSEPSASFFATAIERRRSKAYRCVAKEVPHTRGGDSSRPLVDCTAFAYLLGGCLVLVDGSSKQLSSKNLDQGLWTLADNRLLFIIPLVCGGVYGKDTEAHASLIVGECDPSSRYQQALDMAANVSRFLDSKNCPIVRRGTILFHLVDLRHARDFRANIRRVCVLSKAECGLRDFVVPPLKSSSLTSHAVEFETLVQSGPSQLCATFGSRLPMIAIVGNVRYAVLRALVAEHRFLYPTSHGQQTLLHLSRHPFIETYLSIDHQESDARFALYTAEPLPASRLLASVVGHSNQETTLCSSATFEALGAQLALAIQYCHQHGVVVGPLLPERIRINFNSYPEPTSDLQWGNIEIIGLGIDPLMWYCRRVEEPFSYVDSPSHLRRELIADGPVEWQATDDWISLAGLLFWLKTGIPPWGDAVSASWTTNLSTLVGEATCRMLPAAIIAAPWNELLSDSKGAKTAVGRASVSLLSIDEAKGILDMCGITDDASHVEVDGAVVVQNFGRSVDLLDVFERRAPIPFIIGNRTAVSATTPSRSSPDKPHQSSPPPPPHREPRGSRLNLTPTNSSASDDM